MSCARAVKLFSRTRPLMPCAPAIAPRQTSDVADGATRFSLGAGRRSGFRFRLGLGFGRLARRRGVALAGFQLLALGAWHRPLRRLADLGPFHHAGVGEEQRHAFGRQRAHLDPMLDALAFQHDAVLVSLVEHRVVGAELLDEAAVARAARIRHHDRIEGALLGAAAGETNLECHGVPFVDLLVSVSRWVARYERPNAVPGKALLAEL